METRRLIDLPIRHIEYVFSPAGLPLPTKGETEVGTTSILVRGGAGTGKTTLALGLAHAIAKSNAGLVLYLTTEFSPVEIAYKATLIALSEDIVDVWPGSVVMQSGGVIVESLSYLRHGKPITSSAERKSSVIDEVWKILHPENPTEVKPRLPVRAIVIDALTLPDPGENEGTLRADLVAFVQALENEGISVVLVEELGMGTSAWSSFVVDVVFELSFQPDAETHDLRRKLIVLKCRYALSIPGPHDYGLESGVPAVWPDLFRVLTIDTTGKSVSVHRAKAPQLMIPTRTADSWVWLGASIVLSPYSQTKGNCVRALEKSPGAQLIQVDCGVQTRINYGNFKNWVVTEDEGAHAIGWTITLIAHQAKAGVVLVQDIESQLSHSGAVAHTMRLLAALRLMGFLVCVHSPSAAHIGRVYSIIDFDWSEGKHSPLKCRPRRHHAFTQSLVIDRNATLTRAADGMVPMPMQPASKNPWSDFHTGKDWLAARAALAAIESENPDPSMHLLWKCICAAIAKNQAAIDELKDLIGKPEDLRILDPLLRGLVGTNHIDEADRIIADVASRHKLAPWMVERLRADARLDSDDKLIVEDAVKRLEKLATESSLSANDQAETLFNIAMALERTGAPNQAIEGLEQALAANPQYEPAKKELERLRNPPKPS